MVDISNKTVLFIKRMKRDIRNSDGSFILVGITFHFLCL